MKIIAITQARFGSSRFPGKVLKKIGQDTLLDIHLSRASLSDRINKLIVATTLEPEADAIVAISLKHGCGVYRGSSSDVLDRYLQAAKEEYPDYVVRITSDCPLIDPALMDTVIDACVSGGFDYCSNMLEPGFPDGLDIEVFKFSALEKAWNETVLASDREHVTAYIWRNSTEKKGTLFTSHNVPSKSDYSGVRLTVDEPEDLKLIEYIVTELGTEQPWEEYVKYLKKNKAAMSINAHLKRNLGYMESLQNDKMRLRKIDNFAASDNYRKKIHDLIPGGAHTYSKGDDQFPLLAPAAISHGKGAYIWDIDDNRFLDCAMGLSSVSLGHAYEPVLKRVTEELGKGVNFQRPSYLEMEMAERFLALVPQHDMIKFAKNGSIVTTAAVKLARAYTGRKLVAFPYDHPFYSYDDWFIGATTCNSGVPSEISSLSVTYKGDDLNSLRQLFEKYPNEIACVISEPERSWGIPENYLQEAIDMAHNYGAVYIADEMITGFKTDLPGSITKHNVTPDLATWGKGIANGFSFCALTGKKEIMELGGIRNTGAEKLFLISTTHGGETHALAAAIATIDEFQKNDVIGHNHSIGSYLNRICGEVISRHGLNEFIELAPSDWLPVFIFRDREMQVSQGLRTLVMQEMIRRGILFQGVFVPCFSHKKEDIDYFAVALDEILHIYSRALDGGYEPFLIGEPAKPVFRKYL